MKRIIKAAASVFLSAAILSSTLPPDGFVIEASAEETLSTKLTYEKDGTAVLEITASEWGNQVRYTTDGSVPTMDSKLYFSPLEITEKTTIRIAEFDDGKKIKGIKKTVKPKTAPVTFAVEQDYDNAKAYVTLDCDTLGAKIYYTTDGSKPSQDSALYLEPIEIDEKTKIRARAYCDGYATKTTYSKTVKIEVEPEQAANEVEVKDTEKETETAQTSSEKETEKEEQQEEKKTVVEKDDEEKSVSEKIDYRITYNAEKGKSYITLRKSKSSNIIRYTTDGSAVNNKSKKYSSRIAFTELGVLRAKEYTKSGDLVATLKLNVPLMCAPVEFQCVDMAVGTKTITMSSDTENTTIYYTTDGTRPDPEYSSVYTPGEKIILGNVVELSALAIKDGYKNSSVTYEIVMAIPLVIDDFDFSDPIYQKTADCFNDFRVKNGVAPLVLDEKLTLAANIRAREISIIMDHVRPDGSSYNSVLTEKEINARENIEFISGRYEDPQDFFDSLIGDTAVQNYLLNKGYNYNQIGVGYYEKANKRYWVAIVINCEE